MNGHLSTIVAYSVNLQNRYSDPIRWHYQRTEHHIPYWKAAYMQNSSPEFTLGNGRASAAGGNTISMVDKYMWWVVREKERTCCCFVYPIPGASTRHINNPIITLSSRWVIWTNAVTTVNTDLESDPSQWWGGTSLAVTLIAMRHPRV